MADFGYKSDMLVIAPTNSVMHTKAVTAKEEDTEKLRSRRPGSTMSFMILSHVGVSQNPTGEI